MAINSPTDNSAIGSEGRVLAGVRKKSRQSFQDVLIVFLPLLAIVLSLGLHLALPNKQSFTVTKVYPALLESSILIYLFFLILAFKLPGIRKEVRRLAPLAAAVFLVLLAWDLITLKFKLLPLPYFPGPDKVLSTLVSDWQLLGKSTLYSLRLLAIGYAIGGTAGLVTGILMGWNKKWNYWITPLMRLIGPIPATAWIPVSMTIFPTSFWASIFLISLAVWFPVAVMTGSGIGNVQNAYFEVARTLGADEKYLIRKVAIPAAFPMIFIGLFMGLGMSFLTLIVAEMLGVKAGLGWYINWAQGWAEYGKVYASLIIIALIFSSLITLLFKIRDRILVWQKGLIKW